MRLSPYSFGTLCARGQIRLQLPSQKNSVPEHNYVQLFMGTLFFWNSYCNRVSFWVLPKWFGVYTMGPGEPGRREELKKEDTFPCHVCALGFIRMPFRFIHWRFLFHMLETISGFVLTFWCVVLALNSNKINLYILQVCGTDNVSYNNECKLRLEACEDRRELHIQYEGLCSKFAFSSVQSIWSLNRL